MPSYRFTLDDVLDDVCCVPSCEADPITVDTPGFPICAAHYAVIVRHFMGGIESTKQVLNDYWDSTGSYPEGVRYRFRTHNDRAEEPPHEYVYFARFRDLIKIGTSTNPQRRLNAIPHDELLGVIDGDRHIESQWHIQWASLRHHGEWFRAEDELLAAIRAAVEVNSPGVR